jgi:hypothetical protein
MENMRTCYLFEASRLERDGEVFVLGRMDGRDCILAFFDPKAPAGRRRLLQGEATNLPATDGSVGVQVSPATYDNMLTFERQIAPERRLVPLHAAGHVRTMGMGNRVVVSWKDGAIIKDPSCLAGFRATFKGLEGTGIPAWFIQQSIARELLPEGVRPEDHPGIGHTGGYGPRELLRAGLFAFAALGGYAPGQLPIGADADHAIIVGKDEAGLAASMKLNKLAMGEAKDYSKFTVDTSQLFGFPVELTEARRRQLLSTFEGRSFKIPNTLTGRPGFEYRFSQDEILALGRKYWRPCEIHRELFDYCVSLKGNEPFDYELSLDETPAPAPANELLFYLVALEEIFGVSGNRISSAGPNIGFFKRSDYAGDVVKEFWPLVNACASILADRGVAFSIHSGEGAGPFIGRGSGVDQSIGTAIGRCTVELKLSDIYQEILWHAMAYSPFPHEHALFKEIWDVTHRAVRVLAQAYDDLVVGRTLEEAEQLLHDPARLKAVGEAVGMPEEGLRLIPGVLGYGVVQLKYAQRFLAVADPDNRRPTDEFFRRFVQFVFPRVREDVYRTLSPETWCAYDAACTRYTHMRLRDMDWIR